MTELPPDDSRLNEFLKRYQPAPPNSQGDLEDYVLARIEQDVQRSSKSVFWFFSSAIITGMMMGWIVYRYSTPEQATVSTSELENFILENWQPKTTETRDFNKSNSLSNNWLLLTSPNPNYVASVPQAN